MLIQTLTYRSAIVLGAMLVLAASPAFSQIIEQCVDWDRLHLNETQRSQINRSEAQWQQTYERIQPQIQSDQRELKRLLGQPNANEQRIRELKSRIFKNEQILTDAATQSFLAKKRCLSPEQQSKLQHQMRQKGF